MNLVNPAHASSSKLTFFFDKLLRDEALPKNIIYFDLTETFTVNVRISPSSAEFDTKMRQ